MSTITASPVGASSHSSSPLRDFHSKLRDDHRAELQEILQRVRESVAPVWPLKDYVAVNPFLGMTVRSFLKTQRFLQMFSDCESLMPLSYYRTRFEQGHLTTDDIRTALHEMAVDGAPVAALLCVQDVLDVLTSTDAADDPAASAQQSDPRATASGRMELLSEVYDRWYETNWSETFLNEVSRFCAAHYDTGQAAWQSPWKEHSLYAAWKSAAVLDRRVEMLGLTGFRRFVADLPASPGAAIGELLERLRLPSDQWELMLMCVAFSMPGWSAWARYQTVQAERSGTETDDFLGLLAIRLAYDAALSKARGFRATWQAQHASHGHVSASRSDSDDSLARYMLLRASEVAWRRSLVERLQTEDGSADIAPADIALVEHASAAGLTESSSHFRSTNGTSGRPLAQMVFCIDVRSERFRRNLEASIAGVETFGFAGFFGVPIEFAELGASTGSVQVPALLTPGFQVREEIRGACPETHRRAVTTRERIRSLRKTWKRFQTSASGCFGFVETAGVFSGFKLLLKSAGFGESLSHSRHDGIAKAHHHQAAPSLAGLAEQGITLQRQVEIAAGILRGIGITSGFGRLVILCGHASQVTNNPVQAGLDCGACCGHSGEANARFAAALLNQPALRPLLSEHSITLPDDTHFMAALHNTTSDEITFFDLDQLPDSHRSEFDELARGTQSASGLTRGERLPSLQASSEADVFRRATDWSETRPEWGLSGNAAFIVGPRELTRSADLEGRAFLHSYDHTSDDGFQVLQQIMTAPMVVAHWINMQYYASTVDNRHFGSGTKTIHNVVGQFGILAGNGGDLTTGLAWQSLHDGTDYIHEPLRLLSVIAAPRSAVEDIINRHSMLDDLLTNDWLNLVCIDDGQLYRFSPTVGWQFLESLTEQPHLHLPGSLPARSLQTRSLQDGCTT